uniref:C2H2-type domain-containing protein n=1 Tax=Labrus bergylta TaxID=56723 RepID=A0A3Q3ETV3_9LABR
MNPGAARSDFPLQGPKSTDDDSRNEEESHKKTFSCDVCGKKFLSVYSLIHSRLHTGEKPYTCNLCGKSLRDLRALSRHKLFHSAGNATTFAAREESHVPDARSAERSPEDAQRGEDRVQRVREGFYFLFNFTFIIYLFIYIFYILFFIFFIFLSF